MCMCACVRAYHFSQLSTEIQCFILILLFFFVAKFVKYNVSLIFMIFDQPKLEDESKIRVSRVKLKDGLLH